MKGDLYFGPPIKEERCAVCGKVKSSHNAHDRGCPVGKKHRTLGYTQFSSKTKFTPKEPRGKSKKG